MSAEQERQAALDSYRGKLIESREWEAKLKNLRLEIKDMQREFDKTEDNIKALQSVGQIIGEVLKQLDDERCEANNIWSRTRWTHTNDYTRSYRQGILRSSICRRM
jgi:ATP-dependent 26S proteasome regulatory subunit